MPTPAPDNLLSDLTRIINKVRILTRAISPNQLTDDNIIDYINTFVLYDFPEQLRLFNFRKTFTFYTQPNVDTYGSDNVNNTTLGNGNPMLPTDPFYNFANIYTSIHPPAYCAGYLLMFSQSREQFFSIYPKLNSILNIFPQGNGPDGIITTFTGVINTQGNTNPVPNPAVNQNMAILQNQVLFESIDANNNGLQLVDVPYNNTLGYLVVPNEGLPAFGLPPWPSPDDPHLDPTNPFIGPKTAGYINYLTGQFRLTFPTPPAAGQIINAQVVIYVASRPLTMLFFNNKFILRPVPDQVYRVDVEVYQRPAYYSDKAYNMTPELSQWWQYIAYGAAKKVFEDRMDLESVQLIMPEFKQQERFVLRKTIDQITNERVATIYTESYNVGPDGYGFGNGWGGSNF